MMNHESEGLLRRVSRALGAWCRGILARRAATIPSRGELEFEPVHGWTVRQRDDYLERNPAYRAIYERMLRLCGGPLSWSPPIPEAPPETLAAAPPREQLRAPLRIRQESQPGQKQGTGGARGRRHIPE